MLQILVLIGIIVLILIKIYIKLTTGKCKSNVKMTGKTIIITGANRGIGKETALDLAERGAKVILACRNLKEANNVRDEIILKTGNKNIFVRKLDLASLDSVREFSKLIHKTEQRLDVLINNAGAGYLGNELSADGLNINMQVNYFAPFLLTNLLLDLLKKSAPSRIINVSSMLHRQARLDINNLNSNNTSDLITYCNSKLCNILMSNELSRRLEGTNVTSNSLHPGAVDTQIFQHMPFLWRQIMFFFGGIYFKTPKEGAQTSIHLAVAEEVRNVSGEYFEDCIDAKVADIALDEGLAKKLWELSEEAVKLQPDEKFI